MEKGHVTANSELKTIEQLFLLNPALNKVSPPSLAYQEKLFLLFKLKNGILIVGVHYVVLAKRCFVCLFIDEFEYSSAFFFTNISLSL